MELVHGRGDRYHYYCRGEDQEEEASKNPSFTPSSSSFSLTWFPHADAAAPPIETEHMFDKVVTPSDVGKLNRLVIPKQHAEKHFPLQIAGAGGKGVLLNFEDACGKVWRFRYSYWNSSQSYVLTKGWSRFVKEKGLKAGDVVTFHRSTGPDKQLFIDWKPRAVVGYAEARPVQGIRLFGVNLFKIPAVVVGGAGLDGNGGVDVVGCSRKGIRGMDRQLIPSPQHFKKQKAEAL